MKNNHIFFGNDKSTSDGQSSDQPDSFLYSSILEFQNKRLIELNKELENALEEKKSFLVKLLNPDFSQGLTACVTDYSENKLLNKPLVKNNTDTQKGNLSYEEYSEAGKSFPHRILNDFTETNNLPNNQKSLQKNSTRMSLLENQLLVRNNMLQEVLNASGDIALLLDNDGTVLAINTTAAEKLNSKIDAIRGNCIFDLVPLTISKYLKARKKEVLRLKGFIKKEESYDNRIYDININPLIDSDNKVEKLAVYIRDITEIKQAESQIHSLSQQLIKAQECERQKIALELHDNIAQDLAMIKIGFESIPESIPELPEDSKIQIKKLSRLIHGSIKKIRNISYNLLPPIISHLGLVKAISHYCDDFSSLHLIKVEFNSGGISQLRLNFDTGINLYRLIQEALNNVSKHSQASFVSIKLVASFPNIILRIEDNGIGFDVDSKLCVNSGNKSIGLRSMEERANMLGGKLKIVSRTGEGTRIFVEVPMAEQQDTNSDDKSLYLPFS